MYPYNSKISDLLIMVYILNNCCLNLFIDFIYVINSSNHTNTDIE